MTSPEPAARSRRSCSRVPAGLAATATGGWITATGAAGCTAPAVRDVQALLQITRSAAVRAAHRSTNERPSARSCCHNTVGTPRRRATGAKIAYDQGAWQMTASGRTSISSLARRDRAMTTDAGRLSRTSPSGCKRDAGAAQLVFEPAWRRHRKCRRDVRRDFALSRHRHEHLLDAAEQPAARDVHDVHS